MRHFQPHIIALILPLLAACSKEELPAVPERDTVTYLSVRYSHPKWLVKRLLPLLETHRVTWHWVKGHAENEKNNRCDALAVAQSRKFANQ